MNRYFADISNNNTQHMNFEAYRNPGQHVLLGHKASEGSAFKDKYLDERAGRAHHAGCWMLYYHFGHVGQSPEHQAEFFWSLIKPHMLGHDFACLDIEGGGMDGHGASDTAKWTNAFASSFTRVSGGHHVIGYCSESMLSDMARAGVNIAGQRWWIAAYGNNKPSVGGLITWAWQFTDGSIGPQPHACAGIGPSDVSTLNWRTYLRLRMAGNPK